MAGGPAADLAVAWPGFLAWIDVPRLRADARVYGERLERKAHAIVAACLDSLQG
jgi:hypothetical protein